MAFNDADLGMSPFVAITAADERELAEKLAARDLPGMPYDQRVMVAYYAAQNPGWDSMRIHNTLLIEDDVNIPLYLIDALLTSGR